MSLILINIINEFWITEGCKYVVRVFKKLTSYFMTNIIELYLDQSYLVVNKPADLKINSNNTKEFTLQTYLTQKYPHLSNIHLKHNFYFVHRLDFATSGVICIALSKNASRVVSSALADRTARKYYVALLRGHMSEEMMTMNCSIGEIESSESNQMCGIDHPNCIYPRWAVTKILVLQLGYYDKYPATKVLVCPVTGRRHQIRVHCSTLGHTIVGDYTYSQRKDVKPKRMYLHALRFTFPTKSGKIDLKTEDPFTPENTDYMWDPHKTLNEINDESYDAFENIN